MYPKIFHVFPCIFRGKDWPLRSCIQMSAAEMSNDSSEKMLGSMYIYIWHLKIYIYIYVQIYIYVYQMFFSWISQVIAGNFSAFICFNIFLAFFCQVISKQISPKKNDEECLYPRSVRNASRWSSKMASASSFHRPQNPFVLHEHFGREIDRLVKRMGILLNFSWLIFDLLLQPHASLLPKRISACHPKVFGL